ncbi:MAG: urease accessory protein UreD [Pseudomonadota bacterium]
MTRIDLSMADVAAKAPLGCPHPRARGGVQLQAALRGGRSALTHLRHEGCCRALFPRHPGAALEAVVLNTAGGLTGGDAIGHRVRAAAGATVTIATQTAERAYRALPGTFAKADLQLNADPGARIDWLAQETILFDGASLRRRIEADLAEDARLLLVEPLVFGRAAMGERVETVSLTDQWRIRREGALIYADALRLTGDAEAALNRTGIADGARAMATVLMIAPDADRLYAGVLPLLPETAGASLIRPGVLLLRLLATDGYILRRALLPLITALRGAPMPKVWNI